jgi:hypothetical protein
MIFLLIGRCLDAAGVQSSWRGAAVSSDDGAGSGPGVPRFEPAFFGDGGRTWATNWITTQRRR